MVYLKQIKHLNLELPTNHQIENFAIYISQCFRWDKDASIFNGLFIIPIVDNSEGLRLIQQDSPYYYYLIDIHFHNEQGKFILFS